MSRCKLPPRTAERPRRWRSIGCGFRQRPLRRLQFAEAPHGGCLRLRRELQELQAILGNSVSVIQNDSGPQQAPAVEALQLCSSPLPSKWLQCGPLPCCLPLHHRLDSWQFARLGHVQEQESKRQNPKAHNKCLYDLHRGLALRLQVCKSPGLSAGCYGWLSTNTQAAS